MLYFIALPETVEERLEYMAIEEWVENINDPCITLMRVTNRDFQYADAIRVVGDEANIIFKLKYGYWPEG